MIDEEKAIRLLTHDFDVTFAANPNTIISAIQTLRQYADGCSSQGTAHQLNKAVNMYEVVDASLMKILSLLPALPGLEASDFEQWHRQETYKSKFGVAVTLARRGHYTEAEERALQALALVGRPRYPNPDLHAKYEEEDQNQFLLMTASLVRQVYLAAYEIEAQKAWLQKAWLVLTHAVSALTDSATRPLNLNLNVMGVATLTDDVITTYFTNHIHTRTFLQYYLAYKQSSRKKTQDMLDLLSQVLLLLDKHAVAVKMSCDMVDLIDNMYIGSNQDTLMVFSDIRLGCIRLLIAYCGVVDSQKANADYGKAGEVVDKRPFLSYALTQLKSLGSKGMDRCVYEMWADVFRLQGGVGNMSLALSLYAACFLSHGGGSNCDMKRLADKLGGFCQNGQVYMCVPFVQIICVIYYVNPA